MSQAPRTGDAYGHLNVYRDGSGIGLGFFIRAAMAAPSLSKVLEHGPHPMTHALALIPKPSGPY